MAASLELRLSGGAANADPNASLGGAESSSVVPTAQTPNSIFDDVSGAESTAGDTNYRGLYIHNAGDVDATNVVVWLAANTASADTTIDIALADEAVNTAMGTIADESTDPAPTDPFAAPSTEGTAKSIGTIPAGEFKGVWVRRTVNAGAAASSDTFELDAAFDTAA